MKDFIRTLFYPCLFVGILISCKPKEEVISTDTSLILRFSDDTVTFDTILTSVGSITKRLWVYNDSKNAVDISSISLANSSHGYSLIINGVESNSISNETLYGNDSLLILVDVLIDPNDQTIPYLVKDSILFVTNGNQQDVDLISYGQDAHFIDGSFDACNKSWVNDKAYVVVDSVFIPSGCNLSIGPGCRIFFNQNAKFIVEGSLQLNGSADSLIYFRADNYLGLEVSSDHGYWNGLTFRNGSNNNNLSWCQIENSRTGVSFQGQAQVDSIFDIEIDHSRIFNAFRDGINISAADAKVTNTVLVGAIDQNFEATNGGNFVLLHNTINNRSDTDLNSDASFVVKDGDGISNLLVQNSIIWGTETVEIDLSQLTASTIQNSILKGDSLIEGNNYFEEEPEFVDVFGFDYALDSASFGIDAITVSTEIMDDILGQSRDNAPDIGAFEYLQD